MRKKNFQEFIILAVCITGLLIHCPAESDALPAGLTSPESGVICNTSTGVCFDRYGPSIGFTGIFLGDKASEALLDKLRLKAPEEIFGYRVDITPQVYFLKIEEICFSGGVPDMELTEILFGKDATQRISGIPSPFRPSLWKWQETIYYNEDRGVPGDPENYTLAFHPDGTVRIQADCNMAGGTYSVKGNAFEIKVTHSTLAECPPPSMYDKFLKDLGDLMTFEIDGSNLYLHFGEGAGLMKFSR